MSSPLGRFASETDATGQRLSIIDLHNGGESLELSLLDATVLHGLLEHFIQSESQSAPTPPASDVYVLEFGPDDVAPRT